MTHFSKFAYKIHSIYTSIISCIYFMTQTCDTDLEER